MLKIARRSNREVKNPNPGSLYDVGRNQREREGKRVSRTKDQKAPIFILVFRIKSTSEEVPPTMALMEISKTRIRIFILCI